MAEIDSLLEKMLELDASDLHLRVGMKPRYRCSGALQETPGFLPLAAEDVDRLTHEVLTDEQREQYHSSRELDFAYGTSSSGRFRCNFFQERGGPAAVFRRIPTDVPTLKQLNLPASIGAFAHLHRGLVLVTGSSGSGKTSTLAALVGDINENYSRHVITLEDPIEYVHRSKKSVVHQRGMHYDITDFHSGIVAAVRQDPDVILIGELRDLDSIRQALSAAELGALVFATLHTNSALDAIDRIIDVFPADEQPLVRTMLAQSLAGVVSQVLLRRKDGQGRYPATEVLKTTPAISNLIRENKVHDIINQLQSGKNEGMHTLEDSLERLVRSDIVAAEQAYLYARSKSRFENLVADVSCVVRR